MNRDVQRIIESPAYARLFPETRIQTGRATGPGAVRNNDLFEIIGRGGSYRSAGVGGGITGMGFDFGILDDPVKNWEEAHSPTVREKVWEWYTSTFWTRQAPNARILLIMTRWHADDLAGRILRQQASDPSADRWEVVNLPAYAGPLAGRATGDERAEGEPLWPDQFGCQFLEAARSTLGSAQFDALYQGDPHEESGNHFKASWFSGHGWEWATVQTPRDHYRVVRASGAVALLEATACQRFIVVDPAASEGQQADYSAFGVFATTPQNELLVLHVERARCGVDQIVPRLASLCREWRPSWVGLEANGFQVAVVNQARRTTGIPSVRELTPRGKGKLVRATPAIIKAEARQILLPLQREPWVNEFIGELCRFRGLGDAHDDQVDVLAYAVAAMGTGDVPTVVGNKPVARPII